MHVNKINNKKYIGITKKNPEDRWMKGNGYTKNVHFHRAISKYGWDNFYHVIIKTGLTKEQACEMEKRLIKSFNTMNRDYGYNNCAGGEGVCEYHHTEETKERLRIASSGERNANYGKPMSPERKALLYQINKGSKHSEEHKKKIGDSLRGQHYHSEEFKRKVSEKHRVPVMRDDGVIFDSFKEAAASVGVKQPAISNAIRRGNKSGGYYWSYVETPNDYRVSE